VLVLNAIVDPATTAQGLIVKIFIITFLYRGINAELKLRAIRA
jgi:hypothetical protein